MSKCKRSCCWTPYNCAKKNNCACHVEAIRATGQRGWTPTMETLLAVELQNLRVEP